jgi:hypothetical protein
VYFQIQIHLVHEKLPSYDSHGAITLIGSYPLDNDPKESAESSMLIAPSGH